MDAGIGAAARQGIWVDPHKLQVKALGIGALPVVHAVLARLGFDELLSDYLPEPDPRCAITPGAAIGVLVRNLAVCRLPSAVCRLPSAVCRLPSAVCRLPSAVCRLPSAVCRLPSAALRARRLG